MATIDRIEIDGRPGEARRPAAKGEGNLRLPRRVLGFLLFPAAGTLLGLVAGIQAAIDLMTFGGLAALLWGFKKPDIGILALAFLCTIDVLSRVIVFGRGLLPWHTFNYVLILMSFAFFRDLLRTRSIPAGIMAAFVAVLAGWLLLSTGEAYDAGQSTILSVACYFGVMAGFARMRAVDRMWFYQALMTGIAAAFVGVLYYLRMDTIPVINYNAWAYVPLMGILGSVLGFHQAGRWKNGQLILLALSSVNLLWVFLSTSRGTLLVAVICMLYLFLGMRKAVHRVSAIGILVVAAVLAGMLFGDEQESTINRITALFDPERDVANRTSGRSDLAAGAWIMFKENPLGLGTGSFSQAWKRLGYDEAGSQYGTRRAAHSAWLSTLAENGVTGMLLQSAFALSFALVGFTRREKHLRALGVLVAVILTVAWLTTEFQGKGLWYLAAGTAVLFSQAPGGPRRRHGTPPTAMTGNV